MQSHSSSVGAGGIGYCDERFIEFDVEGEDERWLEAFNRGQRRLPQRRFELLLWRLETANAEATDAALAAAGEPEGLISEGINMLRCSMTVHIQAVTCLAPQPEKQQDGMPWGLQVDAL